MSAARILFLSVLVAGLLAALVWALRPAAVPVDLVQAQIGPMEVTVAAEGITRIREPFAVVAPLTGSLARLPVQVGDAVVKGQTIVAEISPADPALLDVRARAAAEAAVTEAQAAVRRGEVMVEQAKTSLTHSEAELARSEALARSGILAQHMLEDSRQVRDTSLAALAAAQTDLDLNRASLRRIEAQLLLPQGNSTPGNTVAITAPQSGTVLAVNDVSARLVQAGAPLLSIGNLADMEISVDLLSSDAVGVAKGAAARVERWGGDATLTAQVRSIDPAAFTRISALGIEEQRVPVHLDILSPLQDRRGLGDHYRVFVRIVVWSLPDVLQVPQSALFRHDSGWAVYRQTAGRAELVAVEIGQKTDTSAQVLSGLRAGDSLVAYPGNRITAGDMIAARSEN